MKVPSVWLKACPRCHGDLFLEHDPMGWSLACLQCGFTRWLEPAGAEDEGAEAVGVASASAGVKIAA